MTREEAIAKIKAWDFLDKDEKETLETLIPELKESEDERIKNRLVKLIKMSSEVGGFALHKWEADEMLAWLEKQGNEKKYTFKSLPRLLDMIEPTERARAYCQKLMDTLVKEGYATDAKIVGECLKQMNGEKVALATMDEKQGEQKPIDKVEPKFKVGDWIAYNHNPNLPPRKIIQITNEHYVFNNGSFEIKTLEADWHLWTIADAKDGDVLEFGDHGRLVTGILSFVNKTTGKVDVSCLLEGDKFKVGVFYNLDTVKPHPATKEQRDLLFSKMHEAEYMWDAENKQLLSLKAEPTREIEENEGKISPKWTEEDSLMIDSIIDTIKWLEGKGATDMKIDWLKSLKQRMEG